LGQINEAGTGSELYAGIILLGQWQPTRKITPGGLFSAIDHAVRGEPLQVTGPLIATFVLIAVFLTAAVWQVQCTEFTNS